MDNNEKRAEKVLKQFGFNFNPDYRNEIRKLLIEEINNYQDGSSEYLRVLCGYLFCIGDPDDIELIKKAKYEINFDVSCMIDSEWIDSMEGKWDLVNENSTREELVQYYVDYYRNYFGIK